jgi:hypothetical protein
MSVDGRVWSRGVNVTVRHSCSCCSQALDAHCGGGTMSAPQRIRPPSGLCLQARVRPLPASVLALGAIALAAVCSCNPASAQGDSVAASIVTTDRQLAAALQSDAQDIYVNAHIFVRQPNLLPFVATGRHSIIVRFKQAFLPL